jgi:hypothetical protein
MIALLCFLLTLFASPFKSKCGLEAENAALRHQVIILRRKVRGRIRSRTGICLPECLRRCREARIDTRNS